MSNTIKHIKTICLALVLATFIVCAWFFQQYMLDLISAIKSLGLFAPLLFLIIYCLATILILPTMVLTLAGGAIFGPVAGTLLNLLGASWGAACAFLITRYLAYNWFEQRKGERLNQLISGVERRGWQFVAILRLLPLIPFNLVNYGLGLTGIRFRTYLITTFIFLIPAEIIYTYCGHAGIKILRNPEQFYKNTGVVILVVTTLLITTFKYMHRRRMQLKKDIDKD
ncbi:TVP38/TMEM64 family protein [Legionella israelensis]|uniref:TVP38/TMEM64 family protein n=1 Tax=Legionella israelensis TaxID=454 RepID=UPI00117F0D43|nr:TVP38/TMEM64 family protein [Legionella israelensis]QDP71905.1 TVP38/TMEM64 family protein [Legionella israelensis]